MIEIMKIIFSKENEPIVTTIVLSLVFIFFIIIGFAAWYQRIKLRELKKQIDES